MKQHRVVRYKTERNEWKNKVLMILTWNWVPPPHLAFQEHGPGSPLEPRGPGWKPHPGIFQSQSEDAPVCTHITSAHYAASDIFLTFYTYYNTVSTYLSLVYAVKAVGWCSWKHTVKWWLLHALFKYKNHNTFLCYCGGNTAQYSRGWLSRNVCAFIQH